MHLGESLRPKTWEQLIGLDRSVIGEKSQKEILKEHAQIGDVRILMFIGPPGTGKTSTARLFAMTYLGVSYADIVSAAYNEGGTDHYAEINASDERKLETIREKAKVFADRWNEDDKANVLVMDEADGLPYTSQEALKAITEKYARSCIFILCLNKIKRMDDALWSRASKFYFDPVPTAGVVSWLQEKCKTFKVTTTIDILKSVALYYKGDMRAITNDFLSVYANHNVTKFEPRPTFAKQIFTAADPAKEYLKIIETVAIDNDQLIEELLLLNDLKNPKVFGEAALMFENGRSNVIAVLYALTGLVKK